MNNDVDITIDCQGCKRKISMKLKDMQPGNHVDCVCGDRTTFSGDDMRKAQDELNKVFKSLERLGAKRIR